jgi:hypothetical protein
MESQVPIFISPGTGWLSYTQRHWMFLKLKLNYEGQSVCQSVLVSGTHLGPATNYSFSLKFFRHLRVCYFVAPSLMIERVCNLLLLLVLASTVPRDTRPYFIVPILETPPNWRARPQYLNSPRTGWPRYTPGIGLPFRRLLSMQNYP